MPFAFMPLQSAVLDLLWLSRFTEHGTVYINIMTNRTKRPVVICRTTNAIWMFAEGQMQWHATIIWRRSLCDEHKTPCHCHNTWMLRFFVSCRNFVYKLIYFMHWKCDFVRSFMAKQLTFERFRIFLSLFLDGETDASWHYDKHILHHLKSFITKNSKQWTFFLYFVQFILTICIFFTINAATI